MLHKILIFGYVSTVGTNPNQIDLENWVLCVAVNTYKFRGVPRANQTSQMAHKRHFTLDILLIPAPSSYALEI